jgi:cellulose synthase/poly-beta-1,6-N-acetylglucosamine synthase-like glycosyltransferase
MKNNIGIHPFLYEYMLMIDADTEVYPDSLKRLVSSMVHDSRVKYSYCNIRLQEYVEKPGWRTKKHLG